MLKLKATVIAVSLACLGLGSSVALADKGKDKGKGDDTVIDAVFTNRTDTQLSGSGDTILANCGASSGLQTATLEVEQEGSSSEVEIEVRNARPYTVYTVWLRMKGNGPGGDGIGGSPLTGGGATPLAPGSTLDGLLHYSPPYAGSPNPTNGFTTDANGDADFEIDLDFPLVGGAYPFQRLSDAALTSYITGTGNPNGWPLVRIPSPVVDPTDPDISAGFLLRVISHCTDGVGHGVAPGTREAWFQYP